MVPEILDLVELPYANLVAGDASGACAAAVAALGPCGDGVISVTGLTKVAELRRRLLLLARRLALLDRSRCNAILKKHGLGSDVPLKKLDRKVSSFARLLRYPATFDSLPLLQENGAANCKVKGEVNLELLEEEGFEDLGGIFQQLGFFMMEIGIMVARICDTVIGGNELMQSIMECGTAKARLIHYHSEQDNVILRHMSLSRKGSCRKTLNCRNSHCVSATVQDGHAAGPSVPWQQWHYDYGILTVLTAPMFLQGNGLSSRECLPTEGHTNLLLFSRRRNKLLAVRCPPESFIVQVGEAADILSRGKLRSTLHSVSRPPCSPSISRETLVVFLQPAWEKRLRCSSDIFGESESGSQGDELMQDILGSIPPLSSRLKDGMTFAEFSRQTTLQYYGSRGTQHKSVG